MLKQLATDPASLEEARLVSIKVKAKHYHSASEIVTGMHVIRIVITCR